MNELVAQLAAKAGVGIIVAEKSAGAILGFLRDEDRSGKVQPLIDGIAGATEAIETSNNRSGIDRLMGGGLMALGTKLTGLGLDIGEIQKIARELFKYGRDKIGADRMDVIIAGAPGLRHFA